MALVDCAECGKPISTQASACPHCGAPGLGTTVATPPVASGAHRPDQTDGERPTADYLWRLTGKIFFALLAVAIVVSWLRGPSSPPRTTPSGTSATHSTTRPAEVAEGTRTVKGPHFGCVSEESYHRLLEMMVQKDSQAFSVGMARLQSAGLCRFFENGDEVHVVEAPMTRAMVKVRLRGDPSAYWISSHQLR
jgi:hypothetical protein